MIRTTHPYSGDHYIPGDFWMVCDECGLDYRRSDMRERWDHAWVCYKDWEHKHPQEDVRGISERIGVPHARPVTSTNNLITSWGESSTYEIFASTKGDITSAINSVGNGSARSNDTDITAGDSYRLSVVLTLNSGEKPIITTGSSGAADGTILGTLSGGNNSFKFTAESGKDYFYITNTADSDFLACFSLYFLISQDDL